MRQCIAVVSKNCTTLNESETFKAVWTNKRDLIIKKSPGLMKCKCGGYLSRDAAMSRNEFSGMSPSKAGKQKRVERHLNRHFSTEPAALSTVLDKKHSTVLEKKHEIELDKDTLDRYEWKRDKQSSDISDLFSSISIQPTTNDATSVEEYPTLPGQEHVCENISEPTISDYSKAATSRSVLQQKQDLHDYIHRNPLDIMNSWKSFEIDNTSISTAEHHDLHMSIMWFDDYDSTLKWKSKIVGKGGSHIEEIEDTYKVKLSLRNRSNELHLLCFNGDISTRKTCLEYIKKKISQYNQHEWY